MNDNQWQHLGSLLRLPSTDKIIARAEKNPNWKRFEERDLTLAKERDAIQATRPEGCWCLGLGGGDKAHLPMVEGLVFGTYCKCAEGLAAREADKALREESSNRTERHRVESTWANAGIPSRFKEMTLDSSPLAKSNPLLVAKLKQPQLNEDWDEESPEYEAWLESYVAWEGSYFFWGPYGVGKTGLAVGLARELLRVGIIGPEGYSLKAIIFKTVPALLSHLRSTYNKSHTKSEDWDGNYDREETEADVLKQYTSPCTLLVLDDLGAEQVKNTGWVEDRLYQVIGDRHDNEIPTIFTSNLSLKGLAERIGERICWRILEMCGKDHVIHLQGPNLRDLPG